MHPPKKKAQGNPPPDDAGRVAELEEKVKKLTDAAARAQAELQNAKIRMQKEADDTRKFASEMFLLRLLPTIDNFRRAFAHLPPDLASHEWVKGIQAVEQDFMRQVQEVGLRRIDALGEDVDPARHEVLMEEEGEPGKVVGVIEDGYELHGKILRPAKVKAGRG